MPRVIAFVNRALGAQALGLVAPHLVGVVLHPPERRADAGLLAAAIPDGVPIFTAPDAAVLAAVRPTHGLSVLYGEILRQPVLGLFSAGIANLHPSLLPHGRGAHPNAWAIAQGAPAGTTLHLMDAGIDTGPILAQRPVEIRPTDDAAALYGRLLAASAELLAEAVPAWLAGRLVARPQPPSEAAHRSRDLDRLLRVDPDATYTGRQVIDLLRARSFTGHPGAPYAVDGQRLRLRLLIEEESP